MDDLVRVLALFSVILNLAWGLVRLAEWRQKRREAETTAITNVDSQPQIVDMRGYTYNITVSTGDHTVIESVADLGRMANDHQVTEPYGRESTTGGVCPFRAPPKPEL